MPSKSVAITPSDIEKAAVAIAGVANRTPVLSSSDVNQRVRATVYFKCENFQQTGAFKFRGAYNAVSRLTDAQKRLGVVAYSSGNHAKGIALAARNLGVQATVVMPHSAPVTKLRAAEEYGAHIVLYDPDRDDREEIANDLANKSGAMLIASSEHPDVIAGQGTVAKELIDETGPLDYLFVPVGGGGLLAGSAIAAAHWSAGCRVIGVEPQMGNDAQQSLRAGAIIHIPFPATIADGARNQSIGAMVLPVLQAHVNDIVTVSDVQLFEQMRFFVERMNLVAEPTGCLAAAAVMNGIVDVVGARVGIVVTGGNVDVQMLRELLGDESSVARAQKKFYNEFGRSTAVV